MGGDERWEGMDGDVFSKWQRAETLCREKDVRSDRHRSGGEDVTLCAQQCDDLKHAVRELGELRKIDLKEKQFLIRENELQGRKLETTLDLVRDREQKLVEQEEIGAERVRELRENASQMRGEMDSLIESNANKERTVQVLAEQNEELRQTLQDRRDIGLSTTVRVVDRYDLALSRYMDAFPQDKKDLKVQFVDEVTKRSNQAFRLLVNKCHEELICNLRNSVQLFPDPDSFVEAVFDLDLDLQAIGYLRVVQCLNPSLFDTMESTLVRQHDLTKHKIHFRQVELNQARQVFLLAYLNKWWDKNERSGQRCDSNGSPSSAGRKIRTSSDPCGPVGFEGSGSE